MNNAEIKKIVLLKNDIEVYRLRLGELNRFLRTYSNLFVNDDSKEAIRRIMCYTSDLTDNIQRNKTQIEDISNKIECKHEILVDDILDYECPLCKRRYRYNNLPETAKYVINVNDSEHECDVNNIILNSFDEEEAINELLEFYASKQISNDIKIRRLVK